MLVLSRRIGEEIVIAGNIHVTVVAVQGNRVRLGVTAPASVPVAHWNCSRSVPAVRRPGLVPGRSGQARIPPRR
jgi:carbon storage regulator